MSPTVADLITPAAALVLGAALARANSCTVASARRLVFEHRVDWLVGLAVAICWAGLTMTMFAAALPQVVRLPAQLPLSWTLIAGGVLLGIGATINQGCFLGSVARLGRGDLGYGFTLVGIAVAMALKAHGQLWFMPQIPMNNGMLLRPAGDLHWAAMLFAPIALFGWMRWVRHRRSTMLALIVVGIAGGTVYACNPDWSYSSGLYKVFANGARMQTLLEESGAIAVLAGVAISAKFSRRFNLRLPSTGPVVAKLSGGLLMGLGALLIPGGNDTLMLWAIPGLTIYGLVAYGVMIATIAALLASHRALVVSKTP